MRSPRSPESGGPTVRLIPLAVLLVSATLATGCLAPKAPLEVETPRKFGGTTALKNVAVLPFEGRYGSAMDEPFFEMVRKTEVRGRRYFQIVEPGSLETVRSQMDRIRSGRGTAADFAKVRERSGAQGIFSGKIAEAKIRDTKYRDTRLQCSERENTWRGMILRKCEDGMEAEVPVTCTKRTLRLTVAPSLVAVTTGRVVYSERYSRTAEEDHCEGQRGSLKSADEMIDELVEFMIDDIRNDITPEFHIVKVPMKTLAKDDPADEQQRLQFDAAIDFGKADRLDRACETWRRLRKGGMDAVALHYNLALCEESEGDLEAALAILNRTDRMLKRPDEQVNDYLRRLRERIEAKDEIARLYRSTQQRHASTRTNARPSKQLAGVQGRLNRMGYRCGTPDGLMGKQTQQCISHYQSKHRLKVTGAVTNQMLAELGMSSGSSSTPARSAR